MHNEHSTQITVLAPASHQNRRYPLGEDDLLVGRAEACDLRFDDPYLSRVHAKLERRAGRVTVRDLGSSGGTWVNDDRIDGVAALHDGDVVTMGQVRLRISTDEASTRVMPAVGPATAGAAGAGASRASGASAADSRREADRGGVGHAVRYDVDDQRAATINNVGRDQYTAYIHRRESFLREVAATRTRARWLLWTGFIVFALGFGVQIFGSMGFMQGITGTLDQGWSQSATSTGRPPTMPSLGGFQLAFAGAAVSSVGVVLFVVGLVLHVVAASRRKRVDREMPVTPWSHEY